MHHHHPRGDVGQAQGPVEGRVAAAGDGHAFAPERLAAIHQVMHALVLELVDTRHRRLVGAERAHARRDQHRLGDDHRAGGSFQAPGIALAGQLFHALAEMVGRREGRRLLLQSGDQFGRLDLGVARNVVNRLFRIERGALAAGEVQRVDDVGLQLQHAAFENGEQADGAGADDGDIGGVDLGHGRH